VHFTEDTEFRDLLERVRALASHRSPGGAGKTVLQRGLEAYGRELRSRVASRSANNGVLPSAPMRARARPKTPRPIARRKDSAPRIEVAMYLRRRRARSTLETTGSARSCRAMVIVAVLVTFSSSITSTRTLAAVRRRQRICGFVAARTIFGTRAVVSANLTCDSVAWALLRHVGRKSRLLHGPRLHRNDVLGSEVTQLEMNAFSRLALCALTRGLVLCSRIGVAAGTLLLLSGLFYGGGLGCGAVESYRCGGKNISNDCSGHIQQKECELASACQWRTGCASTCRDAKAADECAKNPSCVVSGVNSQCSGLGCRTSSGAPIESEGQCPPTGFCAWEPSCWDAPNTECTGQLGEAECKRRSCLWEKQNGQL